MKQVLGQGRAGVSVSGEVAAAALARESARTIARRHRRIEYLLGKGPAIGRIRAELVRSGMSGKNADIEIHGARMRTGLLPKPLNRNLGTEEWQALGY